MASERNAKTAKDHLFLRDGLEELRIVNGDWKALANQVGISVPMLYAFQSPTEKDPRSPTFETACDLGILHARVKDGEVVESCKRWLQASGRPVPPDDQIHKVVRMSETRLNKPVSRVLSFAHRFTTKSQLDPSIEFVFTKLEMLLEARGIDPQTRLLILANACNQRAVWLRMQQFVEQNSRTHCGFLWKWDAEDPEFLARFDRTQAVDTFKLLLKSSAKEGDTDRRFTGCIFLPRADGEDRTTKLCEAAKRLCNTIDIPQERLRLFTKTVPVADYHADLWWFSAIGELFGLSIQALETHIVSEIEQFGPQFRQSVWEWSAFRQVISKEQLKRDLNQRGISSSGFEPRTSSEDKPWQQIFPCSNNGN